MVWLRFGPKPRSARDCSLFCAAKSLIITAARPVPRTSGWTSSPKEAAPPKPTISLPKTGTGRARRPPPAGCGPMPPWSSRSYTPRCSIARTGCRRSMAPCSPCASWRNYRPKKFVRNLAKARPNNGLSCTGPSCSCAAAWKSRAWAKINYLLCSDSLPVSTPPCYSSNKPTKPCPKPSASACGCTCAIALLQPLRQANGAHRGVGPRFGCCSRCRRPGAA